MPDFAALLTSLVSAILSWFGDLLLWLVAFFFDVLSFGLEVVFFLIDQFSALLGDWASAMGNELLTGLFEVLLVIGPPDLAADLSAAWAAVPWDIAGYYAEMFQLELGITLWVSAYVFRFLVRRIPFIG